jgi:hypothetical protein
LTGHGSGASRRHGGSGWFNTGTNAPPRLSLEGVCTLSLINKQQIWTAHTAMGKAWIVLLFWPLFFRKMKK